MRTGAHTGVAIRFSVPTTYTYDANNRLVSEVSNKTGADVLISYTYDDNGNLLSKLDVNSTAIVRHTYNGLNQLVSSVTGEGTITYTYNAQGIRTSRAAGLVTTHYLLDGGNVIGEVTGDETYTYVRGKVFSLATDKPQNTSSKLIRIIR